MSGEPIEADVPIGSGGQATEFSVSPALPAGLVLDAATGVISGTPTAATAAAVYMVTARNAAGQATARLEIEVRTVAVAPQGLQYLDGVVSYAVNHAIVPNTPNSSGGAIGRYTVSPALPSGLVLDAHTGVISGTPRVVTALQVYTVTGGNAAGTSSARVEIEVGARETPPIGLVYAALDTTYSVGQPIVGNAPHYAGGEITAFSIAPELPAGLSLDTQTGLISGSPSEASPPTAYTVTGHNGAGSATARVHIEVAPTVVAPAGLHYLDAAIVYVANEPIVPNAPSSTGGLVTRYTVSPALPAGLSLHSQTGVLSGAPTRAAAPAAYTVTASNEAGSASARLEIEVANAAVPPSGLHYLDTSVVYVVNEAIVPNVPQYSGGEITHFAVSPALPAGLSMDAQTGVISGTPLVATGETVHTITVTGSNDAGVAHALLHIEVNARVLPPVALTYASANVVLTVGATVVSRPPHYSGGEITHFSVSPALPAGLSIDALTGVISGTPTAVAHAALYTVTGRNAAGSTSARGVIEVKAAVIEPGELHYLAASVVYPANEPIAPNRPSSTGGAITHYTVSPALPAGLSLDSLDGVISGMPSGPAAPATYTVTGTNEAGAVEAQISIEVTAAIVAPARLAYADPAPVYIVGQPIPVNEPESTGGEILHYTVSRPLPAGLSFDAFTGVISGTPTTLVASTVYTVTGSNSAGSVSTRITIEVDPAVRGEWLPTDALNRGRSEHTATLLSDGRVLVAAGAKGNALSSAELFDPAAGAWSETGDLHERRTRHTATLLPDGQVLVTGGRSGGGGKETASAELYDPATGVWSLTGQMQHARGNHTATLLANGKVLVAGGRDENGDALSSAELYDPATGLWAPIGSMGQGREQGTGTRLANGKVLVVGGIGVGSKDRLSSAELYDPGTGLWSPTGNLKQARTDHAMALLANGQVLVLGGSTGTASATAERYDPGAGTWVSTGDMNTARLDHTATLLPNGKVLAAGGQDRARSSTELYDPATGVWTRTGSLDRGRSQHAAVLLQDGRVLVVGGGSSGGSSELFH